MAEMNVMYFKAEQEGKEKLIFLEYLQQSLLGLSYFFNGVVNKLLIYSQYT